MAQIVKNSPAIQETWVQSLGWKDPLEEGMATLLQYSCLENPHGQRRLAGYSPRGRKESDTTEQLSKHNLQKGRTEIYCWINPQVVCSTEDWKRKKRIYINFIRCAPCPSKWSAWWRTKMVSDGLLKEFRPTGRAPVSYSEQLATNNEHGPFFAPALGGNHYFQGLGSML